MERSKFVRALGALLMLLALILPGAPALAAPDSPTVFLDVGTVHWTGHDPTDVASAKGGANEAAANLIILINSTSDLLTSTERTPANSTGMSTDSNTVTNNTDDKGGRINIAASSCTVYCASPASATMPEHLANASAETPFTDTIADKGGRLLPDAAFVDPASFGFLRPSGDTGVLNAVTPNGDSVPTASEHTIGYAVPGDPTAPTTVTVVSFGLASPDTPTTGYAGADVFATIDRQAAVSSGFTADLPHATAVNLQSPESSIDASIPVVSFGTVAPTPAQAFGRPLDAQLTRALESAVAVGYADPLVLASAVGTEQMTRASFVFESTAFALPATMVNEINNRVFDAIAFQQAFVTITGSAALPDATASSASQLRDSAVNSVAAPNYGGAIGYQRVVSSNQNPTARANYSA